MAETVNIKCTFRPEKKKLSKVTVVLSRDFNRARAHEVIDQKLKQSQHGFWCAASSRFQWEEIIP